MTTGAPTGIDHRGSAPTAPPAEAPLAFAALRPGQAVSGVARVLEAARPRARSGLLYDRLLLADNAGATLTARRFDVAVDELVVTPGRVVRITGVVERFRDERGLKLTACTLTTLDPGLFWPHQPSSRAATLNQLNALIAAIADPALAAWVRACVARVGWEPFARAPAAMRLHGATVGGLLAHTVRVGELTMALTRLAGELVDRDVALAGALLHDLGKVAELDPEPGLGYTTAGRLLGHVALGALTASEAATEIPGLDAERREATLHALLAAHGTLEHGSPVRPATLEAVLVHQADRTESAIEAAVTALEGLGPEEAWTPRLATTGTAMRRSAKRPVLT